MTLEEAQSFPEVIQLAEAYRSGALTPSKVIRAHLDRIEQLEPRLGAFQVTFTEDAMRAAEVADKVFASNDTSHPFHGVPFVLKDICDLEGHVTTGGSKALIDHVSTGTATIAKRLLSAGAILLGKTKTVECAFGGWGTNQLMGTPRNPWDMAAHRVPGGSSSGTGVAVSSCMAPCGVGTDTGGSVRLPAGFCGTVGLKVTEGRLPTDGILPLSQTLDTPGPLARSVKDAAAMFLTMDGKEAPEVLKAIEALDQPPMLEGFRLGILDEEARSICTSDVLEGYDEACLVLQRFGARLESFSSPNEEAMQFCGRIIATEAWHNHGALYSRDDLPLDEDVRKRMLSGRGVLATEYLAILETRRRDTASFLASIAGLDALVTPTTPMTAPKLETIDQDLHPGSFTRPVNYFGMCALSLPIGLTNECLPTSLQIIARANDEMTALRIGAAFERARGKLPNPSIS